VSIRRLLLLWAVLALLAQALPRLADPPSASAEPASSRQLTYLIQARLDPVTHVVEGRGTLTWKNPTAFPVPDFHLHLYLNAFRNRHSTFLKESLGAHRGAEFDDRSPGSIDVTSFRLRGGAELAPQGVFNACDDGNPDDRTVMSIPLPEPVPPGGEAVFEIAWTSVLPKAFARTGFGGPYHMVAQWFPKPGVFEVEHGGLGGPVARWNCHQFHGSSEFYADYGVYDVSLTVPLDYRDRVGASGQRVETVIDDAAGTVTYRYQAHDVHDFAWVCDTDFVVTRFDFPARFGIPEDERRRVAALLGKQPEELVLPPVEVTLLLQPEHADQEERHARAVHAALAYMGLWFGPYPYSTLTVVDPDHRAEDTGGMEYPTLITGGTELRPPARGWDPEFVLVHEFGHQYFYGLVGTNEFEHAWMDEGLNTYATARVMSRVYPPSPSLTRYGPALHEGERPFAFEGLLAGARKALPEITRRLDGDVRIPFGSVAPIEALGDLLGLDAPDDVPLMPPTPDCGPLAWLREAPFLTLLPILPISIDEAERSSVARRPIVDPIAGVNAWEYMDSRSYGTNSYPRTAAALRTVEGLVGEAVLLKGLHTYVERNRYGHPGPEQLWRALTEAADAAGQPGLRDVLRTLFDEATTVDYGVAAIDVLDPSEHDEDHAGHGTHGGGEHAHVPPKDERVRPPESTVLLRRHGDAVLPVEVLVRFDDGSARRMRWGTDGVVRATDGGEAPFQTVAPEGTQGRWTKVRFVGKAKVVSAQTDPARRLFLEKDRTNDGLVHEDARAGGAGAALPLTVRLLGWVQQLTTFYGGL
jgi:hypothetical protein